MDPSPTSRDPSHRGGHRPSRRKRMLIAVAVVSTAVIANVGVAWGCSLFSSPQQYVSLSPVGGAAPSEEDRRWLVEHGWEPKILLLARLDDWPDDYLRERRERAWSSIQSWAFLGRGVSWRFHADRSWLRRRIPIRAIRVRAGWPMPCMQGACLQEPEVGAGVYWPDRSNGFSTLASNLWRQRVTPASRRLPGWGDRPVPLAPIWSGFIVNTLLFVALLVVLLFGRRFALGRIRLGGGRCPTCGYPVGRSRVCTECGGRLPDSVRREA